MTCKQISQVKKSIESLEVATRLSRECCIRFAHHQHNEKQSAVIVIYNMLTTLNRSGPHMVLRATSLKVLKNVAQWPSLLRAAYVFFFTLSNKTFSLIHSLPNERIGTDMRNGKRFLSIRCTQPKPCRRKLCIKDLYEPLH